MNEQPSQNDPRRRFDNKKSNNGRPNDVARNKKRDDGLVNAQIRRGEAQRAVRRNTENVQLRASQHVIEAIPVNKSSYNGMQGMQYSLNTNRRANRLPLADEPTLKVIPLGGLGEMGIGKNMAALEYGNDIIVMDMGFLFPGEGYPGINYITPDTRYLEERKHKIRGHIFTHAHLDHIGAFRHIIHKIPAPVYATKFTIGMLEKTMQDATSGFNPQYVLMNPENHERVQLGSSFSVELVRVNHSIPDSTAVVIRTPVGVVVNMGDWRIEDNPVDGRKFDLERLKEISEKEGIHLLMNESTNCEFAGRGVRNEYEVGESIGDVMKQHLNSRVIVATFSSQIHLMQLLLEEAQKHGRKVAFAGYSMIQNVEVALRSNTIKVPKDVVMRMEDIVRLPDEKVMIVCTGSQGELNAVLNRMASGAHRHIKTKPSDVIIFSASIIPGNEVNIVRTVDGLTREGADVMQDSTKLLDKTGPLHFSGHAYYADHAMLINALKPKYYMPIHGEFHMLVHNAEIAEKEAGMPHDNIFVCDGGDVVEMTKTSAVRAGRVHAGGIMYDDTGEVVSDVVLKDRLHMSTEGIFVVVLTVSKQTGRLLTSPDIISRGFIYLRDNEELMNQIRQYIKQKAARSFTNRKADIDEIKREIKDDVTHILYDQTRRTPIVIPVINEISRQQAPQQSQQPQQQDVQLQANQARRQPVHRPVSY